MNLPNYYLADLPPDAPLTAAMVTDACQALKRNRDQYLAGRTTAAMVRVLSDLAANWLDRDYPFRQAALRQAAATGFSAPVLEQGLDAFFETLTEANLNALLVQEFGHAQRLDAMVATDSEHRQHVAAVALGPELAVHIAAGNLPSPALASLVLGLLARSAQFIKCASGAALVPRLFAHSLYQEEPKLGACLELAEWPGGSAPLEEALFREADLVTATGSDETLADIRRRLPARARFLGYGHRVSFLYLAREELAGGHAKKLAALAADDITAWDQLGCLSPHVIYAQRDGRMSPDQFAELLAEELARREATHPRGRVPVETAAAIATRRSFYEVRALSALQTRHWCSPDSTAWTVVFEDDPRFQTSCLHRFIYVKSVADLEEALQGADAVRAQVSTVGLAAGAAQASDLALRLARWGATRICPVGRMQKPPLGWRHDGRPPLADWFTWADYEE